MTSTTSHTSAADGTRLLLRHWAATDPWATMLVVHGLGEHSGRYEQTGADFAAAGIDVHSFDLRGFGASEGERAFVTAFDDHVDDVQTRLAASRRDGLPAVLLGHSMGALIAFRYALSGRPSPDLLVLSAVPLDAEIPKAKRIAARALSKIAPRMALPNDISGEQLSSDPAVGEAYFADPLVYTKTTARLGAGLLGAMSEARADMGRLTLPTLVIHGGADTLVPARVSAPLGELPTVTRVLFPSFRHESFNERERSKAVATVIDWLRGQVAG